MARAKLSMRAASGGELAVLGPAAGGTSPAAGAVVRRMVERGSASHIIREGKGQLSGHLGGDPCGFWLRR